MSRTRHHNPRYASGSFALSYHLEMLSDRERVEQAKRAIRLAIAECGDAPVFCELGCGTGYFSIFAARHCRRVYAVENDPVVREVAQDNIRRLGLTGKIVLLEGDALSVPVPCEKIDILFCEMMSIWLITEPQVPVVRRWLTDLRSPIRCVIPSRVINMAELAQIDYGFDELEVRADLAQFSGVCAPRVMTESRVVSEIVFGRPATLVDQMKGACEFQALVGGTANCARLSSIVEFFPGVNFFGTDTLMPATIVPLMEDLAMTAGDRVIFESIYRHRSELTAASFRAQIQS